MGRTVAGWCGGGGSSVQVSGGNDRVGDIRPGRLGRPWQFGGDSDPDDSAAMSGTPIGGPAGAILGVHRIRTKDPTHGWKR
jgi:hypothetical protein